MARFEKNIFECKKIFSKFKERYPKMNQGELQIARCLISTDCSLELTLFITSESTENVNRIYDLLSNVENNSTTNESKSNLIVQKKSGKHIDYENVKSYIIKQLTINNPNLVITKIKKNTIIAELNDNEYIIKFSGSRKYEDNKDSEICSWNKCDINNLTACDFFIFITEYTFGNEGYGYKSMLFNLMELKNFIKLKNFTGTNVYFGFKWDSYNSTVVQDIRERTNILPASQYDADYKNWVLM